MKLILITILTIFCLNNIHAQAHVLTPATCCMLSKYRNTECQICPACSKIMIAERKAIEAEDKRRGEVLFAKAKAENDATDKAWKDKLAEDAKKAKNAGVVVFEGNKNTGLITKAEVPKIAKEVNDKTIMKPYRGSYSYSDHYFMNEKGERILHDSEWSDVKDIKEVSFSDSCPNNIGWVRIGDKNYQWLPNSVHNDLINSKGNSVINDNNAVGIYHVNDGWFLIGSFEDNHYYLYNLYTGKKVILDDFPNDSPPHDGNKENMVFLKYFPIVSDKAASTFSSMSGLNWNSTSKNLKKRLIVRFLPINRCSVSPLVRA